MRNSLSFVLLLVACQPALAQQLDLFEQTDAELEARPAEQAEQYTVNPNNQPAFTLRGTSRFGDKHHMVLVDRNGQVVKLSWRDGEQVQVPGYAGFQVVETAARQVSLRHPNNDACFTAEELGVQCTDGNVAVLSLSTAQPMQNNGTAAINDVGPSRGMDPNVIRSADGETVILNGQEVFINPFSGQPEALQQMSEEQRIARERRQQARAERLQQIQPVTIDDADVPPGMRRVRTPFGDRLVPERE